MIGLIILCILMVVIIPFNLLLIEMPVWISCVFVAVDFVCLILFFRSKRRIRIKIVLGIFSLLCMLFCLFGTWCNPYWNSLNFRVNANYNCIGYEKTVDSKRAIEDLDNVMKTLLKVHPLCKAGYPDDVEEKYQSVRILLSEKDNITVNELTYYIESILSLLEDGHTSAYAFIPTKEERILANCVELLESGYKIIAINGEALDELLTKYADYYSYETAYYQMDRFEKDLVLLNRLNYLGYDTDLSIEYSFLSPDGDIEKINYFTGDFILKSELPEKSDTADESFVYYEIDRENCRAILTLNSCTMNEDYVDTVHQMFVEIKQLGIETVVVDLRENGGGTSRVVDEFIRYLNTDKFDKPDEEWRFGLFNINVSGKGKVNKKYEEYLFDGDVYILTSVKTYSSAMLFAQYIQANSLGNIVGEACGNMPEHYGEVACFSTPNAGIYYQISSAHFYPIDRNLTDRLLIPDIECDDQDALLFVP